MCYSYKSSMLLIFIEPVILEEGEFQKLEQAACQKITAMNENRKTTYKCPIEKSFFKQDALMKMTGYFKFQKVIFTMKWIVV